MTPEEHKDYYAKTERMPEHELLSRMKDIDFLLKKFERFIERTEHILAFPERAKEEIKETETRIVEFKEKKALLYIRLKGLLNETSS